MSAPFIGYADYHSVHGCDCPYGICKCSECCTAKPFTCVNCGQSFHDDSLVSVKHPGHKNWCAYYQADPRHEDDESSSDNNNRARSSMFNPITIFIYICAAYVQWVLLSIVAWVSHLGLRCPQLQPFLAANGYPSNSGAKNLFSFLQHNIPHAILFVLPHSLLLPKTLKKYCGQYGRLLYNLMAAFSLHFFLYNFQPLQTPVLMNLPIPHSVHVVTSITMLSFAGYSFCTSPQTMDLLGVNVLLSRKGSSKGSKGSKGSSKGSSKGNSKGSKGSSQRGAGAPAGMDAITWMGICTWRKGEELGSGMFAFVTFTGLSILPQQLTIGDVIVRSVAAIYLRFRSHAFRRWISNIESAHHATWLLRASLLAGFLLTAWQMEELRGDVAILIGFFALTLVGILMYFEKPTNTRTD